MVGTYDLDARGASEHIAVRSGGRYVRFIGDTASATLVDSGRWTLPDPRDVREIVFDEVKSGDSVATVFVHAPVERTPFGQIRIVADYDLDTYYVKRTATPATPRLAR